MDKLDLSLLVGSNPDGDAALTLARLQRRRLQKEQFHFTKSFFFVNVQMSFLSNIELLGGSDCSSSRAAGVSWFLDLL